MKMRMRKRRRRRIHYSPDDFIGGGRAAAPIGDEVL